MQKIFGKIRIFTQKYLQKLRIFMQKKYSQTKS